MPNDDDHDKKRARAARAAAELKQTEDLLAGFDRPGRTPRPPPVRDFVDYHLNKKDRSDPSSKKVSARAAAPGGAPNVIAGPNASPFADLKRADPTFVIVKKSYPAWLPWAALLLAMPAAGGLVAYCTLGEDSATTNGVSVTSLPSAATTISSAPSAPSSSPSIAAPSLAEQNVPPVELAPSAAPSPSSPSAPTSSSSPRNNSPAPSGSPDARVDFIRNL